MSPYVYIIISQYGFEKPKKVVNDLRKGIMPLNSVK